MISKVTSVRRLSIIQHFFFSVFFFCSQGTWANQHFVGNWQLLRGEVGGNFLLKGIQPALRTHTKPPKQKLKAEDWPSALDVSSA